jgi:hypothetical protein
MRAIARKTPIKAADSAFLVDTAAEEGLEVAEEEAEAEPDALALHTHHY